MGYTYNTEFKLQIIDTALVFDTLGRFIKGLSGGVYKIRIRSPGDFTIKEYILIKTIPIDDSNKLAFIMDSIFNAFPEGKITTFLIGKHYKTLGLDSREFAIMLEKDSTVNLKNLPSYTQLITIKNPVIGIYKEDSLILQFPLPLRILPNPNSPKSFIFHDLPHGISFRQNVKKVQRLKGILEFHPFFNKTILLVVELPLETYVKGVLYGEMGQLNQIEALKANAVAIRSYGLFNSKKGISFFSPFDVIGDISYQKFDPDYLNNPMIETACNLTKGEILVNERKVINAMYHSMCGGRTDSSEEIFGKYFPYLQGVECNYCNPLLTSLAWTNKYFPWYVEITNNPIKNIIPTKISRGGRILEILLVTAKGVDTLKGELNIRKKLGISGILPSSKFEITKKDNRLILIGSGNGHGVGMCQIGSYGMAKKGFNYKEILSFYYPGCEIKNVLE